MNAFFRAAQGFAVLIVFGCPALAVAQAWLPEGNSFSYSLSYSNIYNKKHFLPNGAEFDAGQTRTNSVDLSASYSFTDWLTVSAGIPYVMARYRGSRPHPAKVDDGNVHGTLTDFHAVMQVQALDGVVALAPYVAVVIPTHGYATMGHAAPGRGLHEYWTGFAIGKSLDLWIPDTYVQARYNYAFVQEVVGISHDRSNMDVEIGYFINPEVSLRLLGQWQKSHGGIEVPIPASDPLFPYHDQLARDDHFNVGAGLAWTMTSQVSIDLLYLSAVSGRNGHKLDQGISVGFSFSPSGGH